MLTDTPLRVLRGWRGRGGPAVEALPHRLAGLLDSVRQTGCTALPKDEFATILSDAEMAELEMLIDRVSRAGGAKTLEDNGFLGASEAIYGLGLNPAILDLAEHYLGEKCLYLGPTLKCEKVDGVRAGNRLWHLDVEDDRVFRILIYLNETKPGGGPFEHLPSSHTAERFSGQGYRSGYLDDEDVLSRLDGCQTIEMYGQAGDAVVFDGAKVLHRAQAPRLKDRSSITFVYVSRRPFEVRLSARLSRENHRRIRVAATQRQADCLPPPRLF